MSDHSSTSSSSWTLVGPIRPGAGLIWAIGFLVLLRIAMGQLGAEQAGRPDIANAAEYLRRAHGGDLEVVAFGSSRMASAFRPEVWADVSGLETHQIANLAVDSGTLWEPRFFLREAGGLPSSVELVIIEIAHWSFNQNASRLLLTDRMAPSEHLRVWATPADRLALDTFGARASHMAEWIWPLHHRRPLRGWIQTLRSPRQPKPRPPPRSIHWHARLQGLGTGGDETKSKFTARRHFGEPDLSTFEVRNLRLLLEELSESDARVLLVLPPASRSYLKAARSDSTRAEFWRTVLEIVEREAAGRAEVHLWKSGRDLGPDREIFTDYGHFGLRGSEAFTRRLFEIATSDVHDSAEAGDRRRAGDATPPAAEAE